MLTITLLFCRCLHISTLSDNLDLLAHVSAFQSGFLNMPCSEVEHSDRVMGAEQCSINYVGSKLSNRQVRENIIANNLANNYVVLQSSIFQLYTNRAARVSLTAAGLHASTIIMVMD